MELLPNKINTILVENDVVKKIEEEKDTATCKLSAAEYFLKTI